jgi:hypothetical protein
LLLAGLTSKYYTLARISGSIAEKEGEVGYLNRAESLLDSLLCDSLLSLRLLEGIQPTATSLKAGIAHTHPALAALSLQCIELKFRRVKHLIDANSWTAKFLHVLYYNKWPYISEIYKRKLNIYLSFSLRTLQRHTVYGIDNP